MEQHPDDLRNTAETAGPQRWEDRHPAASLAVQAGKRVLTGAMACGLILGAAHETDTAPPSSEMIPTAEASPAAPDPSPLGSLLGQVRQREATPPPPPPVPEAPAAAGQAPSADGLNRLIAQLPALPMTQGTPGRPEAPKNPPAAPAQEESRTSEQTLRDRILNEAGKDVGASGSSPEGEKYRGGLPWEDWCADYVTTVLHDSGIIITGGKTYGPNRPDYLLGRVFHNPASPDVMALDTWFQQHGEYWEHVPGGRLPQPGDAVFFRWRSGSDKGGGHTAVVWKIEGGRLYTIEGNSGDAIVRQSYDLNDPDIVAFGSPFPPGQAAPQPAPPQPAAAAPASPAPGGLSSLNSLLSAVQADTLPPKSPAAAPQPANPQAASGLDKLLGQIQKSGDASDAPSPSAAAPVPPAPPREQSPSNALHHEFPPSTIADFDKIKANFERLRARYEPVAQQEGVPWQMLAATHERECGHALSENCSTMAGEPLGSANPDHPGLIIRTFEDGLHATARSLKGLSGKTYGVRIDPNRPPTLKELEEIAVAYNRGSIYKDANIDPSDSPYAMNGYDDAHSHMSWPAADGHAFGKDGNQLGWVAAYFLLGGPVSRG